MSVCLKPNSYSHSIFIVNSSFWTWFCTIEFSLGLLPWDAIDKPSQIFRLSSDLKHNFSLPPPPSMAGAGDSYHQGNIRMTIEDPDLWRSFHEIGTEMIITKPGRYV